MGLDRLGGLVHDHGRKDGLGTDLIPDHRLAVELPDIAPVLDFLDMDMHGIAWCDGAAEFCFLDAHEIGGGRIIENMEPSPE
jgi:hypothetical protein